MTTATQGRFIKPGSWIERVLWLVLTGRPEADKDAWISTRLSVVGLLPSSHLFDLSGVTS